MTSARPAPASDDPSPSSLHVRPTASAAGPDSAILIARLTESVSRRSPGYQAAAFDLVAKYRPRLLASIERRLGEALRRRLEPEDVLCEALMRAFKELDRLVDRRPQAFLHWVLLHVRRTILDHARGAKAPPEASWQGADSAPGFEPADSTIGPASRADRVDLRRTLLAALEEVPELYREVLRDHYVHELPRPEIATKHGRLPNTITHQLKRGVEHWRKAIEARLGPGSADVFFDG
jgi:RNA polymerase sigma factor (sigma-70 family)